MHSARGSPQGRACTVAADAIYGGSEFAHGLENRGIIFALDITSNHRVYLQDPKPAVPPRKGIWGRSRRVQRTNAKTISVATLSRRINRAKQWKRISVWKGTKGYIRVEAAAMRVYFWNVKYPYAPSLWWLVMTREIGSKEIHYSMSNAPEKTTLHSLVVQGRNRYWMERSFQDGKTSVGMADYQVRKWQGWQHHISLCMLAMLFMLTLKNITAHTIPRLSCQDIVLVMNHFLPKRIVTEKDLLIVINRRHEQRQNAELSALYRQKRIDRLKFKVPK
jgi:SRSO17 transposase